MSMTFAPDIPHSMPPGRDVGTGQTVSRVPLSRVMVPEQFAKFVHMMFAVCLLVFVCLQPQDSIPVEFLHDAEIKKSMSFLWNSCMRQKSKKVCHFGGILA